MEIAYGVTLTTRSVTLPVGKEAVEGVGESSVGVAFAPVDEGEAPEKFCPQLARITRSARPAPAGRSGRKHRTIRFCLLATIISFLSRRSHGISLPRKKTIGTA